MICSVHPAILKENPKCIMEAQQCLSKTRRRSGANHFFGSMTPSTCLHVLSRNERTKGRGKRGRWNGASASALMNTKPCCKQHVPSQLVREDAAVLVPVCQKVPVRVFKTWAFVRLLGKESALSDLANTLHPSLMLNITVPVVWCHHWIASFLQVVPSQRPPE